MNEPWVPEKGLFFYHLQRCVESNWAGSIHQFIRYRNGLLRRFWTRKQALARADQLNSTQERK